MERRAEATIKVSRALDLLANEIGREPRRPWWPGPIESPFRREEDLPQELLALVGTMRDKWTPAEGPKRRLMDRWWNRLWSAHRRPGGKSRS